MSTERSRSHSKRRECCNLGNERSYGKHKNNAESNFDVLLTVHLSIFILVINQLDAQNLFLQ